MKYLVYTKRWHEVSYIQDVNKFIKVTLENAYPLNDLATTKLSKLCMLLFSLGETLSKFSHAPRIRIICSGNKDQCITHKESMYQAH